MAPRRTYSKEERARAYVIWITNGQMMKRTARDSGVPEGTIRMWIKEWEENGPPVEQVEQIIKFAGEFVEDATRVRDKALMHLEEKIPQAKPSELVATIGMLSDKINMARGLATSRTEHVQALPPTEEIAKVLSNALELSLRVARERDGEIIDAEVTALPPAK